MKDSDLIAISVSAFIEEWWLIEIQRELGTLFLTQKAVNG